MNFLTVILVTVLVGNQCLGEASPLSADELVFEGLENISTEQPLGLLESIILAEDVQVVGDSSKGGGDKDMTGHSHTNTANDDDTSVNADEVAGGQEVSIEDFPHQVSFRYNDGQQFCGGFIISEYYILTAAHCTEGMVASEVTLHAGSTMRSEGQVIPIAEVIAHPEYDDPQYDKDVAVMRTAERIEFTDKIQPIRLAEEGRTVEPGTKVVISGWGQEQYGESSVVGSLLAVEIPVVSREQCALVYETVTRNQFCAGNFFLGGQGTCQGDSGGAVVQNGTAVGIVSYGRGCGQPLSPSVFADLSAAEVRGFVKEHTGL